MTVAVLHSYTHVLGWAYFRIGWAYFRVKGGPIFGRRVLENTPIPLFEQILNSSPMGVFSRDYGKTILGCLNSWYSGQEALTKTCPSCRAERGYNETMLLLGLNDFLTEIRKAIQTAIDY